MRRHAPRALLQNRRQIIQDRHQPPFAVPGKTERQHQSSHPVPPSEIPAFVAAAVSVDGKFTISGKEQTLRRQSPDLLRLRHQIRDKGGSVFLPLDLLPCLPVRKRREELMDKGSRFDGFVKVLRKKGLHIKILLIHRNAPFRQPVPKREEGRRCPFYFFQKLYFMVKYSLREKNSSPVSLFRTKRGRTGGEEENKRRNEKLTDPFVKSALRRYIKRQ